MLAVDGVEYPEEEIGDQTVEELDIFEHLNLSEDQLQTRIGNCGEELPAPRRDQLQELMGKTPEIFSERPGRTSLVEHAINVTDSTPVRQKAYRVPYAQREVLKTELDEMLRAEIIRPSVSPWASPTVLVPKKGGGIRLCVDYRRLNAKTNFDAYPMPRLEEMFESIGSAKVITTLDLAKGYWQIPLETSAKEKTAFITPFGLFEFEVMPFGLHSAPATFQQLMNHVLRDCRDFARSYLDDIAIFSASWEEHLVHLERVFHCLEDANLHVKLTKCKFGCEKANYLGHVIG